MRQLLKRLRRLGPVNRLVTSVLRGWYGEGGAADWVVSHVHRLGSVRCPVPGGRRLHLWSAGDDYVSNLVYWRGWSSYEPESVRLWWVLAQQSRTILDVGAFVGYYSLLAAHASPQAQVYSLEPHPEVFRRLVRHAELNAASRIHPVQAAAGAAPGRELFFHVPGGLPTSSSLSRSFMSSHAELAEAEVEVVTLDLLAAQFGLKEVDLMKIDTESTEVSVLDGAAGLLAACRPDIVCEVLPGRSDAAGIRSRLLPLGYRVWLLREEGPLLEPSLGGNERWLNYLFTTRPDQEVEALFRRAWALSKA